MHKIKEMLMNELYEYEEKAKKSGGSVSTQELDRIHKLTDVIKNIDKIEALEAGGYSEDTDFMGEGRMYGTSYDSGSSYARGRGRNAKRDSMGRYSRDGEAHNRNMGGHMDSRGYSRDGAKDHLVEKMEEMMDMAETEEDRRAIRQCINKLEHA